MSVLVLSRGDVARLMRPRDYLEAVELGFRASAEGRVAAPAPMHIAGDGGAFHAKGAALAGERPLVALKLNGNFPGNPARGLPTIQGAILVCDAANGEVLAIMDSIEITLRRTAAATALAARALARREAVTVTICGCGDQAPAQVEALAQVVSIAQCFAFDIDPAKAKAFAKNAASFVDVQVEATAGLAAATRESDIVITCTTSQTPFLGETHIRPGTFIAAVGADSASKSEIEPALMARARVVVDVLDQCVVMGDLHHAIEAGAMTRADVFADLAQVIQGAAPRPDPADVVIFDSTGTAIQDVASAARAYELAVKHGVGQRVQLA